MYADLALEPGYRRKSSKKNSRDRDKEADNDRTCGKIRSKYHPDVQTDGDPSFVLL